MSIPNTQQVASGNIYPCRFVKRSGDHQVAQAGSNEKVLGISQEGTNTAPIPDVSSTYAAVSGESLRVFQDNEECLLDVAEAVTAGQKLKSDSNGKGVVGGAGSDEEIGAEVIRGAASGEKALVRVLRYKEA